MALPEVKVKTQGELSVEVFVGQAHFGTYDVWLWDKKGKKSKRIEEGLNTDDKPDIVAIPGTPKDNDGKIVHWRVRVAALPSSPGQHYSVTISLRQTGNSLSGGTYSSSGPIGAAAIEVEGGARITV